MKRLGLNVAKSNSWTRFNKSGDNSSIDIVVFSAKLQNIIKVNFEKHNPDLSDHVGIQVVLKNDVDYNLNYKKIKIINKRWLYKESINLWEQLTNDEMNIDDILQILENHQQLKPVYKELKNKSWI